MQEFLKRFFGGDVVPKVPQHARKIGHGGHVFCRGVRRMPTDLADKDSGRHGEQNLPW